MAVKGFGEEPMMLMTNVDLTILRKALWRTVESYIARKRFFGKPEFIYYAIADGLGEMLRRHGKYDNSPIPLQKTSRQLALM